MSRKVKPRIHSMKKSSRKILKSALSGYAIVGLFLLLAAISTWEYKTRGYISPRGYRIYGEEAKTITWLITMVSLGALIFMTTLLFIRLRNRRQRENYLKELAEQPDTLICPHCCEPFLAVQTTEPISCPKCGHTDIEELEGFFDRHPERRAKCPSAHILERRQHA